MKFELTTCAFLRCKDDSYRGPLGEDETHESPVPRIYWCGKTLQPFGPDDEEASAAVCQPGRACYCQTVEGNALSLD